MKRCDKNSDDRIDKEEFREYYDHIVAAMFKFHKETAKKDNKNSAAEPWLINPGFDAEKAAKRKERKDRVLKQAAEMAEKE